MVYVKEAYICCDPPAEFSAAQVKEYWTWSVDKPSFRSLMPQVSAAWTDNGDYHSIFGESELGGFPRGGFPNRWTKIRA